MEKEYPQIDSSHHVRAWGLEAVVNLILLGISDAIQYQVDHYLQRSFNDVRAGRLQEDAWMREQVSLTTCVYPSIVMSMIESSFGADEEVP